MTDKSEMNRVNMFGEIGKKTRLTSSHPDLFQKKTFIYESTESQALHPLSRSLSVLPSEGQPEEKIIEDSTEKDAFAARVGQLRSYQRWKKWQDGALLIKSGQSPQNPSVFDLLLGGDAKVAEASSPLSSLLTFAQSTHTTQDVTSFLNAQKTRALSRIQGLNYLDSLLKLTVHETGSFSPVLQRVLDCLSCSVLNGGSHYRKGKASPLLSSTRYKTDPPDETVVFWISAVF